MSFKFRPLLFIVLAAVVIGLVGLYLVGFHHYLSIDFIQSKKAILLERAETQPFIFSIQYFFIFVITVSLCIPLTRLLTLVAGFIFGTFQASLIIGIGSPVAAIISLAIARYLFRDRLQKRFSRQLRSINKGLEKDGTYYLLSLRLLPVIPFAMVNILTGLTNFSISKFFWISFFGILPSVIIYANAGTQLAEVKAWSDLTEAETMLSLLVLPIFPWIIRWVLANLQKGQPKLP